MSTNDLATRQQLRRAIIASTIGTSIEWYDFFLYGSAAALVLNSQFFPNVDPTSGVLIAFGTNFVGFAARPVGAHFGCPVPPDRLTFGAGVTSLLQGLAAELTDLRQQLLTIDLVGGLGPGAVRARP